MAMKAPSNHPAAEIHLDEVRRVLEAAQKRPLTESECNHRLSIAMSYCQVGEMLADRSVTIAKLRKMLFGSNNEKADVVLGTGLDAATTTGRATNTSSDPATSQSAPKGHGRNGADQYLSAKRTKILHKALKAGGKCPETPCKGILYTMAEPAVIVRVYGGPPLHAHVCELERLRCNL
jgi:transposase